MDRQDQTTLPGLPRGGPSSSHIKTTNYLKVHSAVNKAGYYGMELLLYHICRTLKLRLCDEGG